MARLNINDLHYIVMEGGGARGNTHQGAVKALEHQMDKRQKANPGSISAADVNLSTRQGVLSIMDYLEHDEELGETVPVIRGVAGTSAGAIASFALALGLNSEEINKIMDFDFANFLSEKDAAKYRMIGEDSDLMVGEDSGLSHDVDPKNKVKKTVGGRKSKPFEYELDDNKTTVRGNFLKARMRAFGIDLFLSSLFSGLVSKLGKLLPFVKKISEKYQEAGDVAKFFEKIAGFLGNAAGFVGLAGQKFLYDFLLKNAIFKGMSALPDVPVKVDTDVIAGLLFDRGMFSGFQVREFFYDVMLYSATRDTLFQRSLIEAYSGKQIRVGNTLRSHVYTKDNLTYENFKIGSRKETDFSPEATDLFTHLQNLTFEEFFEIMGVDYTCSISNFTADTMLYFSYRWTPKFRILEAVGGSMTIPPAIRPLFNASDVYFKTPGDFEPGQIPFPRKDMNPLLFVNVNGSPVKFVDAKGQFSQMDYNLYEHVVKAALQNHIKEKSDNETYISLNNGIEVPTFLDDLREIVIGNYPVKGRGEPVKVALSEKNRRVKVDGLLYEISDELLEFYYNAQFKGLFIDGGYRNNIPINHYRKVLGNLDNVLTIKLDRSFPPDFMREINIALSKFMDFESEIQDKLDQELADNVVEGGGEKVAKQLRLDTESKVDVQYELLVKTVKKKFEDYFNNQEAFIDKDIVDAKNKTRAKRKAFRADRKTILKLIDHWLKFYGKKNYVKPWAVSKSILATAFEGYAYGMERGQIRYQTDHDHFIPLYDFGVGTYDFNLKKVRPLARMAQERAEDDMNRYFEAA